MMSNSDGFLLELVPKTQLKLQHVPKAFCTDGSIMPTYRFRRPPRIEELKQLQHLTGLWSIWQENETLLLLGDMDVFHDGRVVQFDADHRSMTRVTLANNDRCFRYSSGSLQYAIIGLSDHAIAETAAFLWGLDDDSRFREIRCYDELFDFGVFTTEQLGNLFRNNSSTFMLDTKNITPGQSECLAGIPYAISLDLNQNLDSFSDGGHAFVEALSRRKSPFGRLMMCFMEDRQSETYQRLLEAGSLDYLEVLHSTPQQTSQLLNAPITGVGCTLVADHLLGLDWSKVDITPKELYLEFAYYDLETHIDFICSCLRRLAALGDFVKLDFFLYREEAAILPTRVAEELLHAVVANQCLVELNVRDVLDEVDVQLEDIFAVIERHPTLRCLKVDKYSETIDPGYSLLKQLLKRNRFIEVLDNDGTRVTDGDEIEQLYAINRFFRDCQSLTQEPLSLSPSLVTEAVTCCANGDFRRTALLLANHTGAVCEMVQYSSLFSSETNLPHALEGTAGTGSAPKRETESPPTYPCKRKRQRSSEPP